MRLQTYKCEYGTIEYTLPNVKEIGSVLAKLREFDKSQDENKALDWMIGNLEKYIKKVELIFDDNVISSIEELFEYPELLGVLGDLHTKITGKAFGGLKKKD